MGKLEARRNLIDFMGAGRMCNEGLMVALNVLAGNRCQYGLYKARRELQRLRIAVLIIPGIADRWTIFQSINAGLRAINELAE